MIPLFGLGRGDLNRAANMAVVRHFAINIVRARKDKKSIKLRRKMAGWSPDYLETLLSIQRRQPGFGAVGLARSALLLCA